MDCVPTMRTRVCEAIETVDQRIEEKGDALTDQPKVYFRKRGKREEHLQYAKTYAFQTRVSWCGKSFDQDQTVESTGRVLVCAQVSEGVR